MASEENAAKFIKEEISEAKSNPREAIECFDKALALEPLNVLALYRKGTAVSHLGNFGKKYYKKLSIQGI